ncbi:MAG TPA: hypothetical protein VGB71_03780, partial [Flavisolibacter sp.]
MRYFFYSLLLVFIFGSCKKEQQSETVCFDGIIKWVGDPAADGLGWVIYKDDSASSKPFIPRNLDNNLKIDGQKVAVCLYETDEKFVCRCVQPLNKFHIKSI